MHKYYLTVKNELRQKLKLLFLNRPVKQNKILMSSKRQNLAKKKIMSSRTVEVFTSSTKANLLKQHNGLILLQFDFG